MSYIFLGIVALASGAALDRASGVSAIAWGIVISACVLGIAYMAAKR